MTLQEMIQEVWEALGEPTDLNPYSAGSVDLSTAGAVRLRTALNLGQRAVAHWKDPQNGKRLRFRQLWGDGYFQNTVLSLTPAAQVGAGTTEYLDVTVSTASTDRFNGWVLDVDSEQSHIVKTQYVNPTTLRLYPATSLDNASTNYEASTAYMRKNFSFLFPAGSTHAWTGDHIVLPSGDANLHQGDALEVVKVYDMTNEVELPEATRGERFILSSDEIGDPGMWYKYGHRLYFDKAPEEKDWYRYEYYRDPQEMTALTDSPEIPETYHWGIVLWAIEWGYRRSGESGEKYSNKRDFQDFMRSVSSIWDVRFEQTQMGGTADFRRR